MFYANNINGVCKYGEHGVVVQMDLADLYMKREKGDVAFIGAQLT